MKLAGGDSAMGLLVEGVGDCRHALDESDTLVTYALGSCIAVGIWDPVSKVTGLLHFMLPQSRPEMGASVSEHPFRYADTGTALLFRRAYELGADKRRLQLYLAGGASVVGNGGLFNVGKRNHTAIRKLLWKAGVLVHGEDVGGTYSRTVRLDSASGKFVISTPGKDDIEMKASTSIRRAKD
jgi:chemotaxis protein CheD